ncbi:MAG: EamA family transporter [Chitinophagales bacterium]
MIWLILSILCSTLIMVIFKYFEKYKINTFHAIIVNYATCVAVGLPLVKDWTIQSQSNDWMWWGLVLGCLFIGLFFLIGTTAQKIGVSVASVSMKLGYIFPIILAFSFYGESASTLKLIGIGLTILAVILTSLKENDSSKPFAWMTVIFPLVIFLGSGVADSVVQYVEKTFFKAGGFEAFNIILFSTAAGIGFIAASISAIKNKAVNFEWKNVLAGILLGIPNYGSIYFLFKALNNFKESSFVYPANNIGIVVASTLIAVILFSEKLNVKNIIGLILALASIVLMAI